LPRPGRLRRDSLASRQGISGFLLRNTVGTGTLCSPKVWGCWRPHPDNRPSSNAPVGCPIACCCSGYKCVAKENRSNYRSVIYGGKYRFVVLSASRCLASLSQTSNIQGSIAVQRKITKRRDIAFTFVGLVISRRWERHWLRTGQQGRYRQPRDSHPLLAF
jgi:hypothetical protein